jgi:hypothetical protein
VGADGVELDEGQAGSVFATAVNSKFDDNGDYCNREVLEAFIPATPEAEFQDEKVTENDIPGTVKGSADDACFERKVERYKSGYVKKYKISIDFDDGFDIDEAGEGDVWALIIGSSVRGNHDEGLDFGEEDEGGIKVAVWRTTAKDNLDEALKIIESGAGSVDGLLRDVTLINNGGKGAVFEQRNEGDIAILVERTKTAGNRGGDKAGLEVIQKGTGNAILKIRNSDITDGIDAQRVRVIKE